MKSAVLLHLIWYLVESQGQAFPRISFSGVILLNNSYVDLNRVRSITLRDGESVVCHTDLRPCCSITQGRYRADWYFPNGTRLDFSHNNRPIMFERRRNQTVALERAGDASMLMSGIYHCNSPTNEVHDENDIFVRASVYVGLYADASEGDISMTGGINVTVEQYQPLEFTLTCVSTGGPATTVTWTRDSTTVTQGTQTVLNDPVTAQYTHTLTVTGALGGVYTCTVANYKPSRAAVNITIAPPGAPEMFEANTGERQVNFTWSPPPQTLPSVLITSYTVYCTPSPTSLPLSTPTAPFGSSKPITRVVEGFSPNTVYHCSVIAENSVGAGPPANTSFTTLQDYSYIQLHLGTVLEGCQLFVSTNQTGKLEAVTDIILKLIVQECISCNSSISEGQFNCDPLSPTYVTYRARLEGTSETDSGSLVSLIEAWATNGTAVTVGGVVLTVNPSCPVPLSALNEELCTTALALSVGINTTSESPSSSIAHSNSIDETTSENSSASTQTITGGAVAAFLTAVLLTAVALVVTSRRRKKKIPKEPNIPTVDTITNAAYKTHEKQNESIDDYENVTVSNPLEQDKSQDTMQKPEEHYVNVMAAQRWGQESNDDMMQEQEVNAQQRSNDDMMQNQEEHYVNVTATQRWGQESNDDIMQEQKVNTQNQEEHYLNVTAAQRWGQESNEDYGDSEVAYTAVSHSHAPDTPLYDAVYYS